MNSKSATLFVLLYVVLLCACDSGGSAGSDLLPGPDVDNGDSQSEPVDSGDSVAGTGDDTGNAAADDNSENANSDTNTTDNSNSNPADNTNPPDSNNNSSSGDGNAIPPVATQDQSACTTDTTQSDSLLASDFSELLSGIGSSPISATFAEDTTGTLSLGLNPTTLNVVNTDSGPVVAASRLGQGRVLAYSGQDFLSSQNRSTLLGNSRLDALLNNAVRWVANKPDAASLKVLSDSHTLTAGLQSSQLSLTTTAISAPNGLREYRDWTAAAISDSDVLLVQVNEWGTLHLDPAHVADIRAFVSGGGGLILAGSALHWSWWLSDIAEEYPGNLLLKDTGIQFDTNTISSFESADIEYVANAQPLQLWCDYVNGKPVNAVNLPALAGAFMAAQGAGYERNVQKAMERLLIETPGLPVAIDNPQALLAANLASQLAPVNIPSSYPWATTLAYNHESAIESNVTVRIDASYSGNQPTGLYAPPGRVVTVTVPDSLVGTGARLQVGEQLDDLTQASASTNGFWRRAPNTVRLFDINTSNTEIFNVYGGAIYLRLSVATNSNVDLIVDNALSMPLYIHNETTPDAWREAVESTFSPVTILQQRGHVRLVVSTEEARAVTAPGDVMDFWTGFHQHHVELAREPTARKFESHWLFDHQVGYGYANATADRIVYPTIAERWALRTRTGDEDWWLFGHELGHQFQTDDWRGGDITEVAVNLFTMYTLNDYLFGGTDNQSIGATPETVDHSALIGSDWYTADLFGKLQLYRQLVDVFGWDAFKTTFSSYYDNAFPRDTYGSFMDGFAIRFSVAVQRDLGDFLSRWNYPVSASALSTIGGFNYPTWLPPGW